MLSAMMQDNKMLRLFSFLFSSAMAMGCFLAANTLFLGLVFDHYYAVIGLGMAVSGWMLGLAFESNCKKKGHWKGQINPLL